MEILQNEKSAFKCHFLSCTKYWEGLIVFSNAVFRPSLVTVLRYRMPREKGVFLTYADLWAPTPSEGFSVAWWDFSLGYSHHLSQYSSFDFQKYLPEKNEALTDVHFFSSGSCTEILPKQYFFTWIRISTRLL